MAITTKTAPVLFALAMKDGRNIAGKAAAVSFSGNNYFSYAAKIAQRAENGIVKINSRHYSATTSKHVNALKSALISVGMPFAMADDL